MAGINDRLELVFKDSTTDENPQFVRNAVKYAVNSVKRFIFLSFATCYLDFERIQQNRHYLPEFNISNYYNWFKHVSSGFPYFHILQIRSFCQSNLVV